MPEKDKNLVNDTPSPEINTTPASEKITTPPKTKDSDTDTPSPEINTIPAPKKIKTLTKNKNSDTDTPPPDINNILSPEELQALSGAVFDGIVEVREQQPVSSSPQVVMELDLTGRKTLPTKMAGLDIINNRFIRKFRATLSTILRKVVEIDIISNNHLHFAEVSKSIPIPSWINLMQFDPLPGTPFVAFDTELSMVILEYLCGGKGMTVKDMTKKEFGAIEQHLMAKIVRVTIGCLQDIWNNIFPVTIQTGDFEFDIRYFSSVSHDEMFIVTYFSTKIEETIGTLTLALPYTTLEPIKEQLTHTLSHEEQKINHSWMSTLEKYVKQTDANITVEMGRKTLAVRDLIKMKVGDTIILDQFIGDELSAYVEGTHKFKGYAGHYKGNNAFKITSIPFSSLKGEIKNDGKNTNSIP